MTFDERARMLMGESEKCRSIAAAKTSSGLLTVRKYWDGSWKPGGNRRERRTRKDTIGEL